MNVVIDSLPCRGINHGRRSHEDLCSIEKGVALDEAANATEALDDRVSTPRTQFAVDKLPLHLVGIHGVFKAVARLLLRIRVLCSIHPTRERVQLLPWLERAYPDSLNQENITVLSQ